MPLKSLPEVAPQRFADLLLKLRGIRTSLPVQARQDVEHDFSGLSEDLFPLFVAHKAARNEIRPGNNLSGLLVNRHDREHHAIL